MQQAFFIGMKLKNITINMLFYFPQDNGQGFAAHKKVNNIYNVFTRTNLYFVQNRRAYLTR